MMRLTVERSKHGEGPAFAARLEPLWGYPRGTCRTGIASRVTRCAQAQILSRRDRLVGTLYRLLNLPPNLSPKLSNSRLISVLARSIQAGNLEESAILARCSQTLGRKWRWLAKVARRCEEHFAGKTRPRLSEIVAFLNDDPSLDYAWIRYRTELTIENWLTQSPTMQPVVAAASWAIPAIESLGELAEWLRLDGAELSWLADLKGFGAKPGAVQEQPKLAHYNYRILTKKSGGLRMIEAPKAHLKLIQRRILTEILDRVPVHEAAHGFLRGRSIHSFAAPHVGRRVVLRMDLEDFFPSISGRRVQAFFRTAGYPESVADLLGGLCTNAVPRGAWAAAPEGGALLFEARKLYARPHLPQGAPTSPALANICAYRMDCRLSTLAAAAGATYTRYADDLAFSGDAEFDRGVERFAARAAAILLEEGFRVQHRKTRVMRQGVRQYLAGLVVNARVNTVRADYDRLKATLYNCIRNGPENQNREGHAAFREHIEGRVAFVASIHPQRGERLRAMLTQIPW